MNKECDMKIIIKALAMCHKSADEAERNAAFGGMMNDGGAGLIRSQISAYEAGLKRDILSFLAPFVKQACREEDPEYVKFLELKKKFE